MHQCVYFKVNVGIVKVHEFTHICPPNNVGLKIYS
jgi:hypothetical protein